MTTLARFRSIDLRSLLPRRFACILLPVLSCTAGAQEIAPPAPPSQLAVPAAAVETRSGEQIYRDMCVSCHGAKGEGVAGKYDETLYGERSPHALAKLIDRTMPEDDADKLDAEGSARVADYIFHAFYSPDARARNHPPRIDLVRLTNRQYRESVADLAGSFRESLPPGEGAGLNAAYFSSDGMNKKARKGIERIDRALDFDFGEGSPAEGIAADQYSIAWQGSLLARETGVYEFRIRTPNGARLYLNGDLRRGDENNRDDSDARRQATLIDAWVSSGGTVREESARIFLLGGRAYPIRLDYFKYKDKTGSVRLEWKPPQGVWTVLSAPHLSPARAAHTTVTSVPLPADDASQGYERGNSISRDWHEASTRAAVEAVTDIAERIDRMADTNEKAADRPAKLKEFTAVFASRAFRRPLLPEEREFYVDRHFTEGLPVEVAARRALLLALKSPRFLYPELGGPADDWTVASRLALAFWDSMPDASLRDAASRGELRTPEQIRAQAARMAADPRTRAKLLEFFRGWLAFDDAEDVSKDTAAYPDFNDALLSDLRESLERFVEHVVLSEASDYRELLTADYLFVNRRLAAFYGAPAPEGDDFHKVKFDPGQRAGIFSHPFLLTVLSYHKSSSPIHRGVFITKNVLGRFLKSPPMAIEFMDDRFDPSLTMREKVTELTAKDNCMSCHSTINPLGFSLENFDGVGRWRTSDNNKPVDALAEYVTTDGDVVKLAGPRDVAAHAAASPEARRGFVRQLFHHLIKQTPAAYGADTLLRLDKSFADGNSNIRNLMIEIAVTAASHGLTAPPPSGP